MAEATRTLRQQLDERHPDYESGIAEWQMLGDLWDGCGGVRSPYDQITSENGEQLGETFNPLPRWKDRTYLDRHPRESAKKFRARIRNAFYENHFRDIGETILGFLMRKPPQINGLSPDLAEWWKKADATGRPMTDVQATIASRMLLWGWLPVLIDRPAKKAKNKAEAKALGLRTTVLPLYPSSLTGHAFGTDGKFDWARLYDEIIRWTNPMAPPQTICRWRLWTRKEWAVWESPKGSDADPVQVGGDRNEIGEVPIVIFQFSEPAGDTLSAPSPLQSTANISRARYNRVSEKTDIMRGLGVPIICWPAPKGGRVAGIKVGTDSAAPMPSEGNVPMALEVGAAACEFYTAEIERLLVAMYQQARSDFALSSSNVPESGYARSLRFQRQNTQLVTFGQRLASGLVQVARLQALFEKRPADREVAALQVVTETDYDLRELARELEQAEAAARLDIGPTAMAQLRKQVRDGLVTLKDEKQKAKSDQEIEALSAPRQLDLLPPAGQGNVPFRGGDGQMPPARVPEDAQVAGQERAAEQAGE
jgi:hypothetical protein